MRKHYMLLENTPELKKGAILIEECDDGDQGFECTDKSFYQVKTSGSACYDRDVVMKQPQWFKEVKPMWLSQEEQKRVKLFLKKK